MYVCMYIIWLCVCVCVYLYIWLCVCACLYVCTVYASACVVFTEWVNEISAKMCDDGRVARGVRTSRAVEVRACVLENKFFAQTRIRIHYIAIKIIQNISRRRSEFRETRALRV